jgi:hypothetical protein
VTGESKIRSYNFEPIPARELAEDLAIENLRMKLRLWQAGNDVATTSEYVARIREQHPQSAGWHAVGITHPLWMTS